MPRFRARADDDLREPQTGPQVPEPTEREGALTHRPVDAPRIPEWKEPLLASLRNAHIGRRAVPLVLYATTGLAPDHVLVAVFRAALPVVLFSVLTLQGASPVRAQRPERPGEAVVIHGTVRDSLTRGPVPFAILRITETDSSTIADQQGRFRLQLEPGVWQLEVRRIGYRMASATLRARTSATPLDVFMHPIPVDLEAITVRSKDDFASRVVRAAIERKNDVLSRIQNYRYDAYVKFIVRDMEKDEDSTDAVVLITETQTTAYWEQPNRYQEVITARRQSSNLNAERARTLRALETIERSATIGSFSTTGCQTSLSSHICRSRASEPRTPRWPYWNPRQERGKGR